MEAFNDGVSIVCKSDKFGCVNNRGIEIVPLIYDNINQCKIPNFFIVTLDGLSGAICNNHQEVLPYIYDSQEKI